MNISISFTNQHLYNYHNYYHYRHHYYDNNWLIVHEVDRDHLDGYHDYH